MTITELVGRYPTARFSLHCDNQHVTVTDRYGTTTEVVDFVTWGELRELLPSLRSRITARAK
jgi:hypothetical protein